MNPIEPARVQFQFPTGVEPVAVVIAKHQLDQYIPLPSLQVPADGLVVTQWEPNADELDALCRGQAVTIALYVGACRGFPPMRVSVGGMTFP